jgi:HEAT repeat protein
MSVRTRRRKYLTFGAVLLLGLTLIAALCFALSPDVRVGSVYVLERLGMDDSLAALLGDRDKDVRAAAADALVRRGAAAVPVLVRRLDRPDPLERASAVRVLGQIGPAATEAMPALRRRLRDDPESDVRSQAAFAFAAVGRNDPAVIAELVRLLKSAGEDDREAAAFACRMLAADARQAIPALIDALRDPSPEVREEAAKALYAISTSLGEQDADLRDRGLAAARKAMAEMAADGRP